MGVASRSGFFSGSHRAPQLEDCAGTGFSLRKALTRGPTKTLSNAEIISVINLAVMHALIFLSQGKIEDLQREMD